MEHAAAERAEVLQSAIRIRTLDSGDAPAIVTAGQEALNGLADPLEAELPELTMVAISGKTATLLPDLKNADIDPNEYCGFMVPCMAQPTLALRVVPELIETVRQIGTTKKALGAQMSSIDILKKAGLLNGRKYATSLRSGVVRDENIITSMNCPYMAKYEGVEDLTAELTRQFIEMLSSLPVENP
jgi:hypothetical protein